MVKQTLAVAVAEIMMGLEILHLQEMQVLAVPELFLFVTWVAMLLTAEQNQLAQV
jgi:hypothetical protein